MSWDFFADATAMRTAWRRASSIVIVLINNTNVLINKKFGSWRGSQSRTRLPVRGSRVGRPLSHNVSAGVRNEDHHDGDESNDESKSGAAQPSGEIERSGRWRLVTRDKRSCGVSRGHCGDGRHRLPSVPSRLPDRFASRNREERRGRCIRRVRYRPRECARRNYRGEAELRWSIRA